MGYAATKSISESEIRDIALERATEGIAILRNEIYIYVNSAHARHYGYDSPLELIGKSWKILYTNRELTRFEQEIMPRLYQERNIQIEARGKKKDGSIFPQQVTLSLLEDDTLICLVNDISNSKQVEFDLRKSQSFLRKVIDTNPNFIFVKDRDGKFVLANLAVAKAYGTTVDEIVGKSDSDFNKSAEEVVHFRNDDAEVIDTLQEKIIHEEKITDATGRERWLSTVKRPLRYSGNDPVHVLGVATDITEARQLQGQLAQAHKMEALGQLAGGIAHDFNNLLTAVLGAAEYIKLSTERASEVFRYADVIEHAASSAKLLTEKLLGFARKGKHQHTPICINHCVMSTLELVRRTFDKSITLIDKLDDENPWVLGDPIQLEQIILNLAINARDAVTSITTPDHKKEVIIETRSAARPCADVAPGEYIEIIIKDTGCGIEKKHLQKIFEPFFTTKEQGRGTGLGLSMVYGIVRNHGGIILVESTPNVGSTFRVFLPKANGAIATLTENASLIRKTATGHILIVDDQAEVRIVTAGLLQKIGYRVTTVASGQEAIDLIEKKNAHFDLAIVDLIMPDMGGAECLRALKKLKPMMSTVLTTGFGHNNAVQDLLDQGISGFIQKPYKFDQLSEVIGQVLRK